MAPVGRRLRIGKRRTSKIRSSRRNPRAVRPIRSNRPETARTPAAGLLRSRKVPIKIGQRNPASRGKRTIRKRTRSPNRPARANINRIPRVKPLAISLAAARRAAASRPTNRAKAIPVRTPRPKRAARRPSSKATAKPATRPAIRQPRRRPAAARKPPRMAVVVKTAKREQRPRIGPSRASKASPAHPSRNRPRAERPATRLPRTQKRPVQTL